MQQTFNLLYLSQPSITQRMNIELNHKQLVYAENYTVLSWKIFSSNCSISQVLSYAPCQQNNPRFNITTNETEITLSSEKFRDQMTGELIDFEISSLSDQMIDDCPNLSDKVRLNGEIPCLIHAYMHAMPFVYYINVLCMHACMCKQTMYSINYTIPHNQKLFSDDHFSYNNNSPCHYTRAWII